jgi:hypothetical protein
MVAPQINAGRGLKQLRYTEHGFPVIGRPASKLRSRRAINRIITSSWRGRFGIGY